MFKVLSKPDRFNLRLCYGIILFVIIILLIIFYVIQLYNKQVNTVVGIFITSLSIIFYFFNHEIKNRIVYQLLISYSKGSKETLDLPKFQFRALSFLKELELSHFSSESIKKIETQLQKWQRIDLFEFQLVQSLKENQIQILQDKLRTSEIIEAKINSILINSSEKEIKEKEYIDSNQSFLLGSLEKDYEQLENIFDIIKDERLILIGEDRGESEDSESKKDITWEEFTALLTNSKRLNLFIKEPKLFVAFLEALSHTENFEDDYKTSLQKSHDFTSDYHIRNKKSISDSYFTDILRKIPLSLLNEYQNKVADALKKSVSNN